MSVMANRTCRLLPNISNARAYFIVTRSFTTVSNRRGGSGTTTADCDPEAFFKYTAQRWVWNEPEQLSRRYNKFNVDALVSIAQKAAGHDAVCVDVSKLPEGNFNKAFLATMRDGQQLVVKIPNPNSGTAHYTTASEAATMQFVREKLHLPIPKVLGYCTRSDNTELEAEYIVLERVPGIELGRVWENLKPRDKLSVVKQIAAITCTLARTKFPFHGSLYRQEDVTMSESISIDDQFAIGPTVGRTWFDDRRGEIEGHRRALFLSQYSTVRQHVWNNFHHFLEIANKVSSMDPVATTQPKKRNRLSCKTSSKFSVTLSQKKGKLTAGVIWHNDLHLDNIFVDVADPPRITSIIDWQAIPIYPMFLIAHHPSLVEHEGPKPAGFVQPELPENFETLEPPAKKAAKDLFLAQSFWLTYEIEVQRAIPELLHAFRCRDTLPGQLLGMIGSIYDDGEPYLQTLLADLSEKDAWTEVVGKDGAGNPWVPCPLSYSEDERRKQKAEYIKREKDVERKARVLDETGVYPGWNGAVSPHDYDEVMRRLAAAKKHFLDKESTNEQERGLWEQVWPFQDHVRN